MSLMLEEIREQPDVLERTIAAEKAKAIKIGEHMRKRDIDLIVIAARGSSDNAALFGRYLLEVSTGIPVSLSAPAVFTLYDAKLRLDRALVIGVSQSGEGTDINQVLEDSKTAGAFTLAITNQSDSTITNIADETLLIHAGLERSVAATKTYTGQMLHFYLLAEALGGKQIEYERIPALVNDALRLEAEVKDVVQRFAFMENCVVVGRGFNYGNAYELALKLMETCYVVAERFSTADFFHGPLAIVERRFPVILFAPEGKTEQSSIDLLLRLKELGADCLAITNDETISGQASRSLRLANAVEEVLTPIPFIIPAQLFAAHLSEAKGLDPDSPRSLSKVTKTV